MSSDTEKDKKKKKTKRSYRKGSGSVFPESWQMPKPHLYGRSKKKGGTVRMASGGPVVDSYNYD
tara:strand:- start:158 stop:349 length:192 start_codon:yes stop_codon:yes gene_type:complete